jgi:hypothetical protein
MRGSSLITIPKEYLINTSLSPHPGWPLGQPVPLLKERDGPSLQNLSLNEMRAIPPPTLGEGVRGWGIFTTKLKFAVASPLIT